MIRFAHWLLIWYRFREFIKNSLFSQILYKFTTWFFTSLWIFHLFREFTKSLFFCEFAMDSLFNTQINFEYLMFFCFTNSICIKKVFRVIGLNQLSLSRIHFEPTIFSWIHIKSAIVYANLLWILYLFLQITMDSLSVRQNYYEYIICFAILLCKGRWFKPNSRKR